MLAEASKRARILTAYRFLASRENLERTTVAPERQRWLRRIPRGDEIGLAFSLFRVRKNFDVVIVPGHLPGLLFGALQRVLPGRKVHTILIDCLWYRETSVRRRLWKRWQMQFCLKQVDVCVVLAEREIQAYAEEFHIDQRKFVFVPHHNTLHPHRFKFTVTEGDYIFAGGNGDRDYETFVEAVRKLETPCVIACTDDRRLAGIKFPSHVRRVRASAEEFRQLIAGAMIVVVPMEGGHLHSGGQQSFLNAMAVGKAVVVTDPEGAASYIEDGVTGVLVPPSDPARLEGALRHLIEDAQKRKKIAANAVEPGQRHSVQSTYDQICRLADQINKTDKLNSSCSTSASSAMPSKENW